MLNHSDTCTMTSVCDAVGLLILFKLCLVLRQSSFFLFFLFVIKSENPYFASLVNKIRVFLANFEVRQTSHQVAVIMVHARVYVYVYACLCIDCGSWYQCSACGRCHACACVFVCICMRIHMCVGTYIYVHFVAVSVTCTLQVFLALVHGQLCMLHRCIFIPIYTSANTLAADCAHICICIYVCVCMYMHMDAYVRL